MNSNFVSLKGEFDFVKRNFDSISNKLKNEKELKSDEVWVVKC